MNTLSTIEQYLNDPFAQNTVHKSVYETMLDACKSAVNKVNNLLSANQFAIVELDSRKLSCNSYAVVEL